MTNTAKDISCTRPGENRIVAVENESSVEKVFKNFNFLKEEAIQKELLSLAESKKSELSLKEYIAFRMVTMMEQNTEFYNRMMLSAAKSIKLLLDKPIGELKSGDIEKELLLHSKNQLTFCKRWIRWAREYNEKYSQAEKFGKHHLPDMLHSKNACAAWYDAISFPEGFQPGRNICFGTLLKFLLYERRDTYGLRYIQNHWYPCYKRFAPLLDKPFRTIRPHHVMECICDETPSAKYDGIVAYKMLDKFAYEWRLIPQMYSINMRCAPLSRSEERNKVLSEEQITELKSHCDDWKTNIVLTMTYTGLTLSEVLSMRSEDIQEGVLVVHSSKRYFANRKIPIHESIKNSVIVCAEYVKTLNDSALIYLQKKRIEAVVKEVTATYLHETFLPYQLRLTFCSRLLDYHVPSVAVEYLNGTREQFLEGGERTYCHFTKDALKKYIARLA